MHVVSMAVEDLKDVVALEASSFIHPWGWLAFREELACHEAYNYVLKTGRQKLIGYACFRLVCEELHVLKVALARTHRRKGLAKLLFARCLQQIPGEVERIFLEVRPSNQAAIRLYEKLGFSECGRRPGYYLDSGEDAIMMGKIFKGGSNEYKNSD